MSKIKRKKEITNKHGRACGSRCLGPMKFLSGKEGPGLTSSEDASPTNGRLFLCRSVKVNEKVRVRIENNESEGALVIGFTNVYPAAGTTRDPSDSCVVHVPEQLCQPGEEMEFWLNYVSSIMIQGANGKKYFMNAEGLKLREPLYAFLDVAGGLIAVRLLGSRKGDRRSCTVFPSEKSDAAEANERAVKDNMLNANLISYDAVDSAFRGASALETRPAQSTVRSPVSTARSVATAQRHRRLNTNCPSSEEERDVTSLLRAFQQQYISSQKVHVVIRRKKLMESALDAIISSNFCWTKTPKIEFAGEEAFDSGGPRREFFRLLMLEIQTILGIFEGKTGHLFFTYDQKALRQRRYEQAGKLVAWSVMHGGPGPKALDPCLYQLMCGVETELSDFDWHLIPDADVQKKVVKILGCRTSADLGTLQKELGDWICDCGFPGVFNPKLSLQDVPKIYSYVVRHYIYLRASNMIDQFIEGLNSYGRLWETVKANWIDFLPIFTNTNERISRAAFRTLFKISWSKEGTKKREEEEETIYYWELVLKMIEDKELDLTFEELLWFITATDEVPVLGFPQKPSINFYQPERGVWRLPYASTCMMGLFLPRGVKGPAKFTQMLLRAVKDSTGFGKS